MFPFTREVNEECATLTRDILDDKKLSNKEGVVTLLRKRQETFRERLTTHTVQMGVIKLPIHNNTDQQELHTHIGSLQRTLDKPIHRGVLTLTVEESFHVLDIREELALPKDAMLAAVKEGPCRETIESHLRWKKQLLQDITTIDTKH
jgi:hypothetical protein